ncbi:MAG: rhodanese-like domain-containing protein [Myxococcota bacterium]
MTAYTRADLDRLAASGRTVELVDVRSPSEFAAGSVPGARSIPADAVVEALATLARDRVVVAVCNHGGSRSQGAAAALRAAGFADAGHLVGGVHGWVA